MTLRILAIFGLSMCLVACDSDDSGDSNPGNTGSSSAAEGNFISAPDDGCLSMQIGEADVPHLGPGAGITGLVVDNQCNPLSGFKVLCCTDESCVPTDTLADGTFYLGGIMNEIPRKVRIVGVTQGYYDALVYLPISADSLTIASKPIVLAPLSDYVTLGVEDGGTATLAEGQLEVTVAPGAMKYPLGHFTEELSAQRVDMSLVGPFDMTPWAERDGSMAFVFDPYEMKVEPSESGEDALTIAIHAEDHAPAGTVYDLWSADTHYAHMVAAGTATVGDDGVIRVDAGHSIKELQTLVIAPQ